MDETEQWGKEDGVQCAAVPDHSSSQTFPPPQVRGPLREEQSAR